ncbi:MAG: HD domain-containing protein [Pseudomonadota bacterium]
MEAYLIWFDQFIQDFLHGSDEDNANIRLKIDHSLRVLDEAKRITAYLNLDPRRAELAHISALLHDIGRLIQYVRYKTFNDRRSENHARLGVDTLCRTRILADCPPEDRRLILGAISLHNRFSLPERIDQGLGLLARILRDADKLDIVRVLMPHFTGDVPRNGVVTLGLKTDPAACTQSILDDALSGRLGKYEEMAWVNDFKLLVCTWIYDFNFKISRETILERKYLDQLFGSLPKEAVFELLEQRLRNALSKG